MYHPSAVILKNYADILVKFALNSGQGVKPNEVVHSLVPDVAKPMLIALQQSILEAKAHPLLQLIPTGLDKDFYRLANKTQLVFFPKKYLRTRADLINHSVGIIAETNLYELKNTPPQKIMESAEARKPYRDWLNNKEYAGKFTWTLALYATPAMAKEAGLTIKDYWQQIIKACFLDQKDPIRKWKKIFREQNRILSILNRLAINKIHLQAHGTNLWLTLGQKRRWVAGTGRNIPSFEIFTSPDWRGTNGFINFNQPLYRYGNLINNVRLQFSHGKVVKASASTGDRLLQEMLKRPNADKIGEYSLTDSRFSNITKFMANTLFDENIGGKYGNTHLAIGMSYKDAYDGNPKNVKKSEWKQLGFNDSGEHTDIISTADRTVTAILKDGSQKIIYQNGKFTI